ncbi:MAG TPA: 6-carboxyhexanoate--CoA ligase [Malonomonas sp.]
MLTQLNSLRMRAERAGRHISGAERLLALNELEIAAADMLQRALQHPRGTAQKIVFHIEAVSSGSISTGQLLDFTNNRAINWQQGRLLACQLLQSAGISRSVAERSIEVLASGAAPGGQSMRGAMLIDADSGERLESDQARGVRACRMDLTVTVRQELCYLLEQIKLNNPHVVEALTLATKVCSAPGVVAELCWSDDPDYQAGYVASQALGYQRISLMKPAGSDRGGRAFFVRRSSAELPELIELLEKAPLLIDRIGQITDPEPQSGKA